MTASFLTLPVPAGNGVGAARNIDATANPKTLVIDGDFNAVVVIEAAAVAGGPFVELFQTDHARVRRLPIAAEEMRVRVKGFVSGSISVGVSASAGNTDSVALPVPAGNGLGANVDVSSFGSQKSIYVSGLVQSVLRVAISSDGANFEDVLTTDQNGVFNVDDDAQFMRVRQVGYISGAPTVQVAASQPGGRGGTTRTSVLDDGSTLDAYVDGVNGDDVNDGETPATALATIQEVYRKFPTEFRNGSQLIVHLINPNSTPLTYQIEQLLVRGSGNPLLHGLIYRPEQPMVLAQGLATGPTSAALDATPATRVDQNQAASATGNRTQLNFTSAAPGWTVNDLAGFFVRVTRAGEKVFFELPITENDADHVYVDALGIVGTIQDTDTVEIVEPSVRIVSPSVFGILAIDGDGPASASIGATSESTFERIGFGDTWGHGGGTLWFDRCRFDAQSFGSLLAGFDLSYKSTVVAAGGVILKTMAGNDAAARPDSGTDPIDTSVVTDLQIAPRDGSSSSGLFIGYGRATDTPRRPGVLVASAPLSVYRAGGDGIYVAGKGSQLIMSVGADRTLNGRGNTDVGLHCYLDGVAVIRGGDLSTLTGGAGDLEVGTGAAISYGTGAGQFEEAGGYNGNFTRMLEGSAAAPAGDTSRITTFSPNGT